MNQRHVRKMGLQPAATTQLQATAAVGSCDADQFNKFVVLIDKLMKNSIIITTGYLQYTTPYILHTI